MVYLNEKELLIGLQKSDLKAFDAIYHRYHHAIYANVLKITRDESATEDIVQEVFMALWVKHEQMDPENSVSGWLFTVSYNKSIMYLKKSLRKMLLPEPVENSVSEQELNLHQTRLELLNEAIQTLSPQKRKVFDLCKIEGKSYEETAKELQISKHTVKEYLSTAVASVKNYIKQHPACQAMPLEADILILLYVGWHTLDKF